MERGHIKLNNPEKYSGDYRISQEKVDAAIKKACDKWLRKLEQFDNLFPGATSDNDGNYTLGENTSWTQGMHTGATLLAYELTGNEKFLEFAKAHMPTYVHRFEHKIGLLGHDVGFVYSPACIAYYKLTGDEKMKEISLKAANYFRNHLYSEKGGFILRSFLRMDHESGCRTMMDTLMNIPLLFWAYEQTGEERYMEAAKAQVATTEKCLIRPDGSSYHHYKFDVETREPVCGVTFQGHADESTWSRGHAWGVYGFPTAYSYTKDESMFPLHRDVTNFMLNHLPESYIPYYDYDFVEECDEAKDASAGLISACGMLEMCKYLDADAPEVAIYKTAANKMIEAVIDNCMDYDKDFDGLVNWVTCSVPHDLCIDGCTSYGDYFLLVALMRLKNPEWNRYW